MNQVGMAVGNRLVGAVENKVKDAAAHVMDKTFENPGDACPSREPDDTTPITLQYGEKLNEKTMQQVVNTHYHYHY